jgi:hypothetical protein
MADFAAKRYATACPTLRKSFRAEARAETLFRLGECEEAAGNITSAAALYDDYLALFGRLSPSEQKEEKDRERVAVRRREALEKDIPHVIFKLPAQVPDGLRVTRRPKDGGDPVEVALGTPLPIDPGEHYIATSAPDRATWEKRFFIHKGEQLTVDLDVMPPDPAKATRFSKPIEPVPNLLPPLEPRTSGRRVAAYVTGGLGVAALLTSAVTGAITWGQKGTIDTNCMDEPSMKRICNTVGQDAADLAKTLGTVSTVTIVAGGVLLGTGVVLYLTEPTPNKLGAAPGRVTFGLNAAPMGAGATAKWTW